MAQKLKLGVRELVEFCCRSGDLGHDGGPAVTAIDGLHTHQKIQQRYRDVAQAEYRIKLTLSIDGAEVELGGRIDLLFAAEQPPRVEEIKTVISQTAGGDETVHWAQLTCYGCAYARERQLPAVCLSLNRVQLFSRHEQRQTQILSRDELDARLEQILRRYLDWHRQVSNQRVIRAAQARALEFPYSDFRPQQRRFAAEVFRAIREGRQLMVEAPTGSGKTVSTLFPAIKAMGEGMCEQIVYLSAKISGQQQALDTIEMMPAELSYVVLEAKARSCPCQRDEIEIDDDGRCIRCLGFFERLPAARDALFHARRLDIAQIQATAKEYQLCPFELSLQMLPWVDIVVCDFNYVFDPLVQLSYFSGDTRRKVLLIDELHNLVDRARGMYSASLVRKQIKQAAAAATGKTVVNSLNSIQRALDRELRQQAYTETVAKTVPAALMRACRRFAEKLGYDLLSNKRISAATLEFSKAVFRFRAIGQLFAQHHRSLGYKPLRGREFKLICLNALDYLRDCYPLFHAVCGFSATLSPVAYFQQALGLKSNCRQLRLEPVFPRHNLGVYAASFVDTRYRQREAYIDSISDAIARCYRAHPGNYLVFFSAYDYMQQVYDRFRERQPQITTRLQQREFDAAAQRQFLAHFFESDEQLGFAIMGGRFAEGIDYQGDALIGAIIVGVGLPQANVEQRLIGEDFESLGLDSFDYAFRCPGLIRVMQSAGRVIRNDTDRGVVVLLERRFCQPGYARYLPQHWQPNICNDAQTLEQSLLSFWNDKEDNHAPD